MLYTMSSDQTSDKINWVLWALIFLILYQVAIWFAWVIPSRYYVGFDEGWHLEISQQLYYSLVDYGIFGLLWKFVHAMQAKPPLVSLLPIPMYLIFGNHVISATAVNLVWLILLNIFLFRLVRYYWGNGPALLGCIFLQTIPLFQGLSRIVMAEYGTAVLVIMFMYFLFTKPLSKRRAVILGIIIGLGLLGKVLFPTYILGPLVWIIVTEIRQKDKEHKPHPFYLWLISGGIGLILAGPWYFINYRHWIGYTFQSTYGDLAKVYRFGTTLGDVTALWAYLIDFLNSGVTAYQAILVIIAWIGCRALRHKGFQKADYSVSIGIALWFLFPFLIYLPSLYRNFKFMMPFFAPISIFLGILMWRSLSFIKQVRWRWIVLAPFFLWPNFGVIYASFPLGSFNQPYRSLGLGPLEFLPQRAYMGFPIKGRWPYQEILEYVSWDGACIKANKGRLPTLGMAVDITEFNRSTMLYEQVKNRLPVSIYWAPLGGTSDPKYGLAAALALTSQQDYVLFRVPNLMAPEFTNKFNDQIRESIHRGELPFRLIKEYPLPDGAKALLYRRET